MEQAYMTAAEAAKKWGISDERNDLARNNRWKQAKRVS